MFYHVFWETVIKSLCNNCWSFIKLQIVSLLFTDSEKKAVTACFRYTDKLISSISGKTLKVSQNVLIIKTLSFVCVHVGVCASFCSALCRRWSVSQKWPGSFRRICERYHVGDLMRSFAASSPLNLTSNYRKRQTPSVTPCFCFASYKSQWFHNRKVHRQAVR